MFQKYDIVFILDNAITTCLGFFGVLFFCKLMNIEPFSNYFINLFSVPTFEPEEKVTILET